VVSNEKVGGSIDKWRVSEKIAVWDFNELGSPKVLQW